MCARRFLIFVFILILLFVAGAFAIFEFGQQVLIKRQRPGPFPGAGQWQARLFQRGQLARSA